MTVHFLPKLGNFAPIQGKKWIQFEHSFLLYPKSQLTFQIVNFSHPETVGHNLKLKKYEKRG